jgi:hypothetical protein
MSRADITRIMVPFCLKMKVMCSRRFCAVFPNALRRRSILLCVASSATISGSFEEDTFRLGLTDVMFIRALAAVAIVPVKPGDLVKLDHDV